MKLSIDGGTVVCSIENKNRDFLSACQGLLDGWLHGKLKMVWDDARKYRSPDYAVEENCERLKELLTAAKKHGIESDEAVGLKYAELTKAVEEIKARRKAQKEAQEREEKWSRLCAGGCGFCSYKRRVEDDFKCIATGDYLQEKNVPGNIRGVYVLFNYEAFPSENCPYKINKKQGEEL